MWIRIVGLALALALSACGSAWRSFEETPQTHTVQAGENLYQLSFRYRLDPAALAQWNGVGRNARIYAGQTLRLRPPLPGQLHPVHGGGPRDKSGGEVAAAKPRPQPPQPTPVGRPSTTAPFQPAAEPKPRPTVAPAPAPVVAGAVQAWQWPVRGELLRGFGGGSDGIDIGVPAGTTVTAVADGRVVYGGSALKGYGLLLIIEHPDGIMSAYGHTATLLVGEGEQVRQGQPVARSGLGPKQQPLLHFEARKKGQPVDPRGLLPR